MEGDKTRSLFFVIYDSLLLSLFALGLLAAFVVGQAGYGVLMQHNSI